MIEVVYAAALGCGIPFLCWNLFGQVRNRKQNGGLWTRKFVIRTITLVLACWLFRKISMSIEDNEFFDPYEILELQTGATRAEIRASYKRLSMLNHPDKLSRADRDASRRFARLVKAHKTLIDPQSRKNYELYGNPDGPQSWSYGVPIPEFLKPGDNASSQSMAVYYLGYVGVLIAFVYGAKKVMNSFEPEAPSVVIASEDVLALDAMLSEASNSTHILECMACVPQLCSLEREEMIQTDTEMQAISEKVKASLLEMKAEPVFTPGGAKDIILRQNSRGESKPSRDGLIHPKRTPMSDHNLVVLMSALHSRHPNSKIPRELSAAYVEEQAYVLGVAELLLDASLQLAASKGSLSLFLAVIECKGLIRRKVWSHDEVDALQIQEEDLQRESVALPSIRILSHEAETWGETQIAVGDKSLVKLVLERGHAPLYKLNRPISGSVLSKGEPWWVLLASVGKNGERSLLNAAPVLVKTLTQPTVEVELSFNAPSIPGDHKYVIMVRSPVFLQCGTDAEGTFRVVSQSEIIPDDDVSDEEEEYEDEEVEE